MASGYAELIERLQSRIHFRSLDNYYAYKLKTDKTNCEYTPDINNCLSYFEKSSNKKNISAIVNEMLTIYPNMDLINFTKIDLSCVNRIIESYKAKKYSIVIIK